jgi:flagellin
MSSILTNNGAMVALQTLNQINKNLGATQSEISTGKSVANAKDNSAVWAISKTMESDVAGFKAIRDSLNLGDSTVSVARTAAERTTDLLKEIKAKVVASQEENVDRSKIQADIKELSDQIKSTVGAAQFNGLNLVKGSDDVAILSSLDRSGTGVATSDITVARKDLTADAGTYNATGTAITGGAAVSAATVANTASTGTLTIGGTIAAGDVLTVNIGDKKVDFEVQTGAITANDVATGLRQAINAAGIEGISAAGAGAAVDFSSTVAFEDTAVTFTSTGSVTGTGTAITAGLAARAETVTFSGAVPVSAGDGYRVSINGKAFDYVAGADESTEDVARGLKTAIDSANSSTITARVTQNDAGQWQLQVDNNAGSVAFAVEARADGEATGGLAGLNDIDVRTSAGADRALEAIETMITNSIDAAASLGSAQGRIGKQADFMGALVDAFTSGIGSLVDANMEETSARLQALQVQQQLATQSLSIANQAPQSILSLFR